ncbi:MAG: ABC transporter permease [Pikeienuella sp.]
MINACVQCGLAARLRPLDYRVKPGNDSTDITDLGPIMRQWITSIASIGIFFAVWRAVVILTDQKPFILPGPDRVAEAMWKSRALIWEHTQITILEVLVGIALGMILGVAAAILLAYSRRARELMRPTLVFGQAIPIFILSPIFTLWFGFGYEPKILMAVLITYFPVTSAYFDGLMNTPKGYLDLARVTGASKWRIMLHIRMAAALPSLGSALRLAAVFAPIGAVISEWIGAAKGLGYLMLLANGRAKIDLMFGTAVVLAVVTVILFVAADKVAKRLERVG